MLSSSQANASPATNGQRRQSINAICSACKSKSVQHLLYCVHSGELTLLTCIVKIDWLGGCVSNCLIWLYDLIKFLSMVYQYKGCTEKHETVTKCLGRATTY